MNRNRAVQLMEKRLKKFEASLDLLANFSTCRYSSYLDSDDRDRIIERIEKRTAYCCEALKRRNMLEVK